MFKLGAPPITPAPAPGSTQPDAAQAAHSKMKKPEQDQAATRNNLKQT